MNMKFVGWLRAGGLAGLFLSWIFAPSVQAVPYVDPTAIEADSPEMLEPTAIHSFCGQEGFIVSLDPVKLRYPEDQSKGAASKQPLDEQGGTKIVSCKQGEREVVATLEIRPPGGNGMCGAVHFVHVKFSVDGQMLLSTKFAEYCAPSGLTSVALLGRSGAFPPSTLRICGYWSEDVAASSGKGKLAKRSFECADFSAGEMLERKLFVTGPSEISSLDP